MLFCEIPFSRFRIGARYSVRNDAERGTIKMDEIHLVPYDPDWPRQFTEEAARIREVLSPEVIDGLEHFGSTASGIGCSL